MPTAHEIDYAIRGHEMQFVEIELDPGAGGTLIERELKAGEELHVDTGCLVGLSQTVDYRRGHRRRREVDDLRRRGCVLRATARPRPRVASKFAVLASRGPNHGEHRARGPAHG